MTRKGTFFLVPSRAPVSRREAERRRTGSRLELGAVPGKHGAETCSASEVKTLKKKGKTERHDGREEREGNGAGSPFHLLLQKPPLHFYLMTVTASRALQRWPSLTDI